MIRFVRDSSGGGNHLHRKAREGVPTEVRETEAENEQGHTPQLRPDNLTGPSEACSVRRPAARGYP
jgi:hypothetical protein